MGMITFRRYRMRKMHEQNDLGYEGTAAAHATAAKGAPAGTPLPDDFPAKDELAAHEPVPYLYYEDLYQATRDELTKVKGVGRKTADRIIKAVEAWEAEQE